MKKSKIITLVLITAALVSCSQPKKQKKTRYFLRSDSTAGYSRGSHHSWFYAFRPYGHYSNGNYTNAGYYSSGISSKSNIGSNGFKSNVVRGGFGRGFSVSS